MLKFLHQLVTDTKHVQAYAEKAGTNLDYDYTCSFSYYEAGSVFVKRTTRLAWLIVPIYSQASGSCET